MVERETDDHPCGKSLQNALEPNDDADAMFQGIRQWRAQFIIHSKTFGETQQNTVFEALCQM